VALGGGAVSYERGTPVGGLHGGRDPADDQRRPRGRRRLKGHHIAIFTSLICAGARRNPATCGANRSTWKRLFDPVQ